MDPVRSSLSGGVVATLALAAFLFVGSRLFPGTGYFRFVTFTGPCELGGFPYCTPGTATATAIAAFWFAALFVIAWPLFFAGFTWGLPGESGVVHGALFGLILWTGYFVTVSYGIEVSGGTLGQNLPLVAVGILAYLVYGVVLGGVYDHLAGHRTLLDPDRE